MVHVLQQVKASHAAAPTVTLCNRYELFECLATGAVATVYRGHDRTLGRPVAIKQMHPGLAQAGSLANTLLGEARAGASVHHPNVVNTLDFRRNDLEGGCFLVMELLQGRTLERVLDRTPRPPLEWTLSIVAQILAGLAAAHARGVIHRDIKPGNVMLERVHDDDGHLVDQVKLCDFGISRVARTRLPPDDGRPSTRHGVLCGTPGYIAPEQLTGGDIDHRADIYATGMLLHEMTTGQVPFAGDQAPTLEDLLEAPRPRPPSELCPDIDPALERVILKAIAPDPDHRYQSARDMRSDLLACAPHARWLPLAARPELLRAQTPKPGVDAAERPGRDSGVRAIHAQSDLAKGRSDRELAALERRLRRRPRWPLVLVACAALAPAAMLVWPEAFRAGAHWLANVVPPLLHAVLSRLQETVQP